MSGTLGTAVIKVTGTGNYKDSATFNFTMNNAQRTAFEEKLANENYKFAEYVVDNANN